MSEVQARPATRGRSSARGGRGGHGARGPRKQTNGDHASSTPVDTSADQGELGELKLKYLSQLSTLKELFPDWSDVDLVLTLRETDGDVESTIERITEGNVFQFAEVRKAKDRSRSKVKDVSSATSDTVHPQAATRGNRTRAGQDSARGSRGRPERGRGGTRGGRSGAATNGTRATGPESIPTTESSVWDTPAPADTKPSSQAPAWDQPAAAQPAEPEAPKATAAPQPGTKKTWASMFAAPKPSPAPKPVAQAPPVPMEQDSTPADVPAHEVASEETVEAEQLPIPPAADELPGDETTLAEDGNRTPTKPTDGPVGELAPSKDELTEDNVEHLPDASNPPPTETATSTVASSRDIGSVGTVATPLSNTTQTPIGRPAMGGYATTAHKATGAAHRSASFQRRLLEQQEAVVMPGNHAVDRAAVQFGSMGLNGDVDTDALDVDEDREEAETRTQPPQHSPVAQPRAALPPAPRQPAPLAENQPQEALPTPKQAPGLPPVPQHQQSPQASLGPQAMQQQGSQTSQQYGQFGRYGQGGMQSEAAAPAQKPYDPFGQQASQTSQFDSYPSQSQTAGQPQQQQQGQPQGAGFSAPSEYSSQYFTSDQQRNAYNNYYQNYNQQNAASQQEAGSAQQRTGSAFGTGPSDSSFPPSQAQQAPSRYGEAQTSGHTTPNPVLGAQHPTGPASQQGQHMHQQPHTQPGHAGGYPYNHPYYGTPYYQNYMSQYAGGYGQQGYGAFGGGKGMYNQPHHGYGVSPQASYDQHSSSPANVGGFGQSSMHGRDSALGGGLGDYGRSGSAQPSQNQHNASAGAGFGGLPDMFTRTQAGGYQNQPYGQQQGAQQTANEDSLKPFGDSKTSGGPTPSALGQPGRPGSATNTPGQTSQSGLPPPQSHQQGFGGGAYPSHLNQLQGGQGNQYGGGLGGLGGQQQHGGAQSHQQSGGYGQYGGFGGAGYGSYNRGGWGTNYGQH